MNKVLITSILTIGFAWGTDFSSMTTQQLIDLRGKVPADERASFRAEMRKRMQSMTPEERQALMNGRRGNGRGAGTGAGGGGTRMGR